MLKKVIDLGFFYSLVFIAITFPFPFKISNLGILFLIVFWLLKQLTAEKKFKFNFPHKYDRWIFYSFLSFFIWNALSLLYTEDMQHGMKALESKLSLVVLPLIFFSSKIPQVSIMKLLKYYIYSLALCTIYLLFLSIKHYYTLGSFLTYHDFTGALDFHAVFYSYYIFLAIISSVYLLVKQKLTRTEIALIIISLFLSFISLIISASKNVLVVTTLFIIIGLIFQAIKNKIGFKEIIFALLLFGAAFISISQIPVIKDRISELVQLNGMENFNKIRNNEKIVEEDIPKFNGTSLRVSLWYVGIKQLQERKRTLIGLSPGDRRAILNEEHYKNGMNPWYENYNLHNQFIQTLVELGIIGLLIYLILHLNILLFAYHQKNLLLIALILGLILFQMTESIIERNKGIVFFCYFLLILKQLSPIHENRNLRN